MDQHGHGIDRRRFLKLSAATSGLALVLGLACAPGATPPPAVDAGPSLPQLPEPRPGWVLSEGPDAYSPETLYEYLNGGAPLYLGFGFESLERARYQLEGDPLASLAVDVYDMGSRDGAFGIYRSVVPEDAPELPWCAESYAAGTVRAGWRGKVYIHVEADDDRPELLGMSDEMLSEICAAVGGDRKLPAILEALPRQGLVPRSEMVVGADLLGHSFLPGGVVAEYRIDGASCRLFFSELADADAASSALGKLGAHVDRWGRREPLPGSEGSDGFRFSDPGLGEGTVVAEGRWVAGVAGEIGAVPREALLGELTAHLRTY